MAGGSRSRGQRCHGEWITMHNVVLALHSLAPAISHEVPQHDFSFDLTRMPTFPRSRFRIRNVRLTPAFLAKVPRLPSSTAARDSSFAESRGELSGAA
jgi:hypothetical protein